MALVGQEAGLLTDWVDVPFEVQKPQDGLRVDAYLAKRLRRYSRSAVQKMIDGGQVFLAGRAVKPATRLAAGQTVIVRYPRQAEPAAPVNRLEVVFEDDWLLAVDKPGMVLSHPTDRIVENAVTTIVKRQFPGHKLHLVHRLDRETSGVLLLAKDPATARLLTNAFFEREVRKLYIALTAGRFAWTRKTVNAPIDREGGEIKVRQTVGAGQSAVTSFERLAANDSLSLIAARPKTGRLHQIRVHLAHLGHPVLGDKLYTGDGAYYMKAVRRELGARDLAALGAPRQMLHARTLELSHPITEKKLRLQAPLPEDFKRCLSCAGLEVADA